MGFIESLLGSGLANAITLHAIGSALKQQPINTIDMSWENEPIEDKNLPTNIQKELYQRANEALNDGNYTEATSLLIRAIRTDPNNYPECYGILGICYHLSGQFDVALECYDKTLHLEEKISRSSGDMDSNRLISSYLSKNEREQIAALARDGAFSAIEKYHLTFDSQKEKTFDKKYPTTYFKELKNTYKDLYQAVYYSSEYKATIQNLSDKCEKRESIGKGRKKVPINSDKTNTDGVSTVKRVCTHTKTDLRKKSSTK
jgi:tetratricopeptide (TPR) repeat protein